MPKNAETIAATARRADRRSRIRLSNSGQADHPSYDAALARELLARTCELPASKPALVAMLTEYRRALHDLAVGSITRDDLSQPVSTSTNNS